MSASAHTPSPSESIAVTARLLALLDRVLPFAGPAIALLLGLVAVSRRPLDIDEAAAVAAAQGPFTDVIERALSDDPARAGYLAILRPVVTWQDSELWIRLPSVLALVVATVAIYRLGRRLLGRHVGGAASIMLASSLGVVLAGRSAGPLALALAAMLVSSALFARALERGHVVWWALYAVSAAVLPLTHPIAATALAAQIAALAVARRRVDLRVALPAVGVAALECGFFLVAAIADRADAPDGAGPLELADVAAGVGWAVGWSPVVAGLAVWGLVSLSRRREEVGLWKVVLLGGLALWPLVAVLIAGVALPVYPRDALVVAAGGVALAAAAGVVAIADRPLRWASTAAVGAVALAALVSAALEDSSQDWRAAAAVARSQATSRDTVVVLPERAQAAFRYYAGNLRTSRLGRGDAVTVVVAGNPALAVAAARQVVSPPRYALLEQRTVGSGLVVQRWVRP